MSKYARALVIWLLALPMISRAQLPPPPLTPGINQWFKGWYITMEGDTVNGFIFLSNQIENQDQFKYAAANPPGADFKIVESGKARGFKVKDRVYESLPIILSDKSTLHYVRRLENGYLLLYSWYSIPLNGTVHDGVYERPIGKNDEKFHQSSWLLKKGGDGPTWVPEGKNFVDFMSSAVADDRELAQKIMQKLRGYRSGDVLNIVQEYNQWKALQH